MARPPIIRLFGHADNFDIEFTHKGGTTWLCEVPPDTSDGVYAVELWAVNELNEVGYWTGELYMCNGACHLKIERPKYGVWFKPSSLSFDFEVRPDWRIIFEKRCPHELCSR